MGVACAPSLTLFAPAARSTRYALLTHQQSPLAHFVHSLHTSFPGSLCLVPGNQAEGNRERVREECMVFFWGFIGYLCGSFGDYLVIPSPTHTRPIMDYENIFFQGLFVLFWVIGLSFLFIGIHYFHHKRQRMISS